MKVLHISQFDSGNGASWAMNRLHHALLDAGVDSSLWVQRAFVEKERVTADNNLFSRFRPHIEALGKVSTGNRKDYQYSTSWLRRKKIPWAQIEAADVLHLHWINGGFLPIELLKDFKKPIVWTFHDMWGMTGMRHYPKIQIDADGYLPSESWTEEDLEFPLDRKYFDLKKNLYSYLDLSAIAPSQWMKAAIETSDLWKNRSVSYIENTIDTKAFVKGNALEAKKELGLPLDKPLVLFGAMSAMSDERKGFKLLEKILRLMNFRGIDGHLIVFGNQCKSCEFPLSIPTTLLGRISNQQKLIKLYQACDVMIVPSLQDNFPNTIVESICCHLPVVTYAVGGMPDMVVDEKTGHAVTPFSITEFVDAIEFWLKEARVIDGEEVSFFRERVSPQVVAQKHLEHYQQVLRPEATNC